ncbi:hypothetical protein [Streptomyces sp. NPDC001401]|uniref:hypothetical protein n=1 Tax=Streptomyces sp. NPDC001401 TaxID=3364570 RepID=UPI0036AC2748
MSGELSIVAVRHDEAAVVPAWRWEALREDLLALDVERVGPPALGPAPPGSRSAAAEAVGALAIALQPALPVLEAVVTVVRDWIGRSDRRSVVLELRGNRLELTGVDSADQRRLAEEWLAAVRADGP